MGENCSFSTPAGMLMALDIRAATSFEAGPPRPLFHTPLGGNGVIEEYRVTADGQRFLLKVPVGGPVGGPLGRATRTTLVQNWPALLKQ